MGEQRGVAEAVDHVDGVLLHPVGDHRRQRAGDGADAAGRAKLQRPVKGIGIVPAEIGQVGGSLPWVKGEQIAGREVVVPPEAEGAR